WRYDDRVAVDERGFADQPPELTSLKVVEDVPVPDFRAVGPEAVEIPRFAEDVQPVAVDGRRAARAWTLIVFLGAPERLRPGFLPVRAIDRDDGAAAIARALQVHAIAGDRHRSVPVAQPSRGPDDCGSR